MAYKSETTESILAKLVAAIESGEALSKDSPLVQQAAKLVKPYLWAKDRREKFEAACRANEDRWLPANGGSEEPFVSRSGRRLLYCYNPAKGRHAYVDVDADIVLTDTGAQIAMQMA